MRLIATSLVLGALLVAGCGGGGSGGQTDIALEPPYGTFISTSEVKGEGTAFSTPVWVDIGRGSIGWKARCNSANAKGPEITADRLVIGDEIISTAMGCAEKDQQQDEDLAAFFGSDPYWRLDGDRLTLSNDSVSVVLDADDDRSDY